MIFLKKTRVYKITKRADSPQDLAALKEAADVIKSGGLVVFPTETVYGLGANALDENAARSIYEAKGRPQNNPLIMHFADKEQINMYCNTESVYGYKELSALMPAPLTIILPAKENVPGIITAGLESVAVRVPESVVARKLVELSGVPIAAPSANLSGKPSPTCARHVLEDMDGRADIILDGGDCEVGLESTIVTLCEKTPTLLRPGGITYETLCRILGEVDMSRAVLESLKPGDKILSPGMMYKHYAPDKPVVLLKGSAEKCIAFVNELDKNEKISVICYDEDKEFIKVSRLLCAGKRNDNALYASKLFSLLRETNSLDCERVYAFLPEDTSGISLAIYNRLLRAAGFDVCEL